MLQLSKVYCILYTLLNYSEIQMSSKQLNSILAKAPSATVGDENKKPQTIFSTTNKVEEITKIVARIPVSLKNDIRKYVKNNKEETESTLIIKGLKKLGFNIDPSWTVDRRKLR